MPTSKLALNTRLQTKLIHEGRQPLVAGGHPVNPPIVRASTVLFDSLAAQRDARARRSQDRLFTYGARGNPTNFALEDLICEIEGGWRCRLFPSGLSAIALTLMSYLKPGDHVLLSDSVYEPVRHLAKTFLDTYGIGYSFFSADGTGIESLIGHRTRMIYAECPGSLVYEICDLPALASLAKQHGLLLVTDNTWGVGPLYQPLALGADVSIVAATKYLSGHSDVMMGAVTTTQQAWQALAERCDAFGISVSPDDAYLVLRGARTLTTRLAIHEKHALAVAGWLQTRSEVAKVFCPALPIHEGHAIWRRDFHGTNGLVSVELAPPFDAAAAERMVERLQLFGKGSSWGGFESLVALVSMPKVRTVADWSTRGPVIRLHLGLEHDADLIADLEQAFSVL